jgi:hypothetical protein
MARCLRNRVRQSAIDQPSGRGSELWAAGRKPLAIILAAGIESGDCRSAFGLRLRFQRWTMDEATMNDPRRVNNHCHLLCPPISHLGIGRKYREVSRIPPD